MGEATSSRTVRRETDRPPRSGELPGRAPGPPSPTNLIAALVALLALVACETLLPPPPPEPPPGTSWQEQGLTASSAVAALTLTVEYDADELTFRGLGGVSEGAIAAVEDDAAGTMTLTWFSPQPRSGHLLTLHWTAADGAQAPVVTGLAAYDAAGEVAGGQATLGALAAGEAGEPVLLHDGLPALEPDAAATAACRAADYPTSLAQRPLGDLDASGDVDVRDVVLLHAAAAGGELADGDAFALFHADLTGDCLFDDDDVRRAFLKAALPDADAAPVAKPLALTYAQLRAGTPVVVGNAGDRPLSGLTFRGENLNGSTFTGDHSWVLEGQSAVWTLTTDPNDALGTLRVTAGDAEARVAVGNLTVLVAGQSNAVGWDTDVPEELRDGDGFPAVRMLGNDYVWRPATEPLDDPSGQLDPVSEDATPGTSAGTALGRLLHAGDEAAGVVGTGRAAYLIPAALGGSRMTPRPNTNVGWYLGSDDLAATDRGTLFGSAMYRALVSSGLRDPLVAGQEPEGGPVSAVFWYQGESDNSTAELRHSYAGYTASVFQAMRSRLAEATSAVEPVVIYAQLAAYGCCFGEESASAAYVEHLKSHDIAERQRRLEEGAMTGTPHLRPATGLASGVTGAHMVVTHDLPRFDRVHLSAEAQQVLARRVALAYQEHVLGWDVDGTGPRLVSLTRSGPTVTLTFDRDVTAPHVTGPAAYSGYFTAWDGPPNGGEDYSSSYGTNTVAITKVERHPADARKVVITLASSPATVYLRYMRPHEPTATSAYLEDVIRGVESGLPAPSFGPLRVN